MSPWSLHLANYLSLQTARSQRRPVQNNQFPFNLINNRKCEEGQLYKTIKSELHVINTVAEKRLKDSVTKFMDTVTSWYSVRLWYELWLLPPFSCTVDRRGDSKKYVFNMALLLCVYYEYYCQKVISSCQSCLSHLHDCCVEMLTGTSSSFCN